MGRGRDVTESITEVTLLGGECHRVNGDPKTIERLILDAARGSIMQFAWLTDARTAEPVGVNPEHVMTLRGLGPSGQSATSSGAEPRR